MYASRKRLGELLLAQKFITEAQLEEGLRLQRERFQPLGQILVQQGFITEEKLLQVCAMQQGVAAWYLQIQPPQPQAAALVPAALCRAHHFLPVASQGGKLTLAMRDPGDIDAIDMVRNLTRQRVEPVLVNEERLVAAIDAAHGTQAVENSATMNRFVSEAMGEIKVVDSERDAGTVSEAEMRPVVGLVNQVIAEAIRMRASDIHVEPRKDRVEIRYRVDGQLQKVHEIPSKLKAALIARFKIMAELDIVEYRIPQDGRIAANVDGRVVDLRVSVLPNYYGQRLVLRILDKGVALRQLDELGFSPHNLGLFDAMIRKPYGLVLVTGPTGSGKTTTLYAALNQIRHISNNIMTCEDPVEYDIDGINQSHVNEKVGLTFAAQLRAILRQDPDIVLVGEIRDKETAETAIRAALTGHLVLSTLHCNDALSAVPRLMDMGVEPFLLSTALIGVTAQRLVRLLCPHCKAQAMPSEAERSLLGERWLKPDTRLWQSVGCVQCGQTGYKGRVGLHEALSVTREMQSGIAAREPVDRLREIALSVGYRPMQDDACERIVAGQTTLSEAQRLVFFETPMATPVVAERPSAAPFGADRPLLRVA